MNKINALVSGEKGFWIFKHAYTKNEKLNASDYVGMQRDLVQNNGNTKYNGNSSVVNNNKTYQFNDKQSIVDSLFEYADKDKNGTIDENEYCLLLAENVTDGVIGEEKSLATFKQGMELGSAELQMYATKDTVLTPDYKELIDAADKFSKLKNMDITAGADKNHDGKLSKEEFENSVLAQIATDFDKLNLGDDSKSYEDKLKIMQGLSDGRIAQTNFTPNINWNYSMGKGTFNYNTSNSTSFSADYDKFVEVANKYWEQSK